MIWQEFKDFFLKDLGDSKAFVDSIWCKIKRDCQYQDKSVQDWATQLKYLKSILIEFDPDCAPEENTMIWYIKEGLRPLVQVKIEQHGRLLDSFEEMVKKAVNAKANAALRPRPYARNTNQQFFRGSRPSAAKTSTKSQLMKDPQVEKPKPRFQKQKVWTS